MRTCIHMELCMRVYTYIFRFMLIICMYVFTYLLMVCSNFQYWIVCQILSLIHLRGGEVGPPPPYLDVLKGGEGGTPEGEKYYP